MLKLDNLIDKTRAQAILADLYGKEEKLVSLERLTGGKSNAAYKLVSSNHPQGVLLRSAHRDKKTLLSFEKNMMSKEAETTELLRSHDVPVPRLLNYSPCGTVIDREYAVYEYISSDYPTDRALVDYKSIDGLIDRMHLITCEGFGYFGGARHSTWHAFICALADELFEKAKKYKFFWHRRYIDDLKKEIYASSEVFNEIKESVFVHNDIGCKNFLFEKQGEKYTAKYVIDIERSLSGDPDFEYARAKLTDRICYSNVMLHGRNDMSPARAVRLRIYALLNDLISMHIMRGQYFVPDYFYRLKKAYIMKFENKGEYIW